MQVHDRLYERQFADTYTDDESTEAQLRAARDQWWDAERRHKAEWTFDRLHALDSVARRVPSSDQFDWACAIWSDYIDGQRADERFEPLSRYQLREQASVFHRLGRYLPAKELLAFARVAWGDAKIEVFAELPRGGRLGKVTFTGNRLNIRAVPNEAVGLKVGYDLTIWDDGDGTIKDQLSVLVGDVQIAVHPVFATAAAVA